MEMPLDAMNDLSDDALLVLFANGDKEAPAVLTYRLTPMIFGLAMRLLNNTAEAEDVTQDAMIRLFKIAPDWRQGDAKVTTWLYRVVRNLATDRLRKRRNVPLDQIAEPVDDTPGVVENLQASERRTALQNALDLLPERQREAVVLRHLEGLANPDIAVILDISVEAVESLVARGKRRLADLLLGQKQELGIEE